MSTSSSFFLIFGLMTANACIENIFKKDQKVPLLRFSDIISTHHVYSELDCSFRCLNEPACFGFIYKHGVSGPSVNCKLSNTTSKNNIADDDDQGWVHFIDIRTKKANQEIRAKETLTTTQATTTTLPQHKECFGYQWLTESNRNTNYLGNDGLCDDGLSTGWYRFGGQAGSKMATSCVPGFRCATLAPSWLDGIHPTVAEGKVTRKVCYSVNDCCLYSNYIEVVNCGKYYVYELSKPPACNLRYCGSNN